jgi:ABC-type transporter Mla maintaining outer membrane lipid asymmetry permease subunit MlaE
MDWKLLGLSLAIVYGVMAVSGTLISLLSTQLQCSKINIMESLWQGCVFAFAPSIVYGVASSFILIRNPFASTLESFGVPANLTQMLAVGYLTMIMAWISSVTLNSRSEKAVCVSNVREMNEFKQNLLAKLQEKEAAREKNQEHTPPQDTT